MKTYQTSKSQVESHFIFWLKLLIITALLFLFTSLKAQENPVDFIIKKDFKKLKSFAASGGDLGATYQYTNLRNFSVEEYVESLDGYLINFAYSTGNMDMFEWLLEQIKPLPNYKQQISSCLTQFASDGNLKGFKRLIEAGADVNLFCEFCYHHNPLLQSLQLKNRELIDYLLSLNPDLKVLDAKGKNILHYVMIGEHFDLFKKFVEQEKMDIWNGHPENSLLFVAASSENPQFLSYLLPLMKEDNRFDINQSDSDGFMLIHYAAYSTLENVKLLISLGSKVQTYSDEGMNPLHYAAVSGKADIANYLIKEQKMDPNEISMKDESPLLLAVYSENLETVKVFQPLYQGDDSKAILKVAKKNKEIYAYLKPLLKDE